MKEQSPGKRFKIAVNKEKPLQIVGAINAYCALMATHAGYRALYLSGGGVAAASYGLPDLAITTLDNVLEDARRITGVTEVPLLVDIDTGWGSEFNIARTIRLMEGAGVAAVHIEDQPGVKRCGHRPGKHVIPVEEMVDRIKAAVDAKVDEDFVIMARTDAIQKEGLSAAIERGHRYIEAGADMIFAEAVTDLDQYREFVHKIKAPILANITEFGKTPLFTLEELRAAGVSMALYPLSAFRAMSKAAENVYKTLREAGTQESLLKNMQSREELYKHLDYYHYEAKLDGLKTE
ncbi:MAG TPA: methylisocitrate lyase [Gammaproteobacteria bacterium]|nr:methylisocitrate lyase [Gammaproteobacteria bacterium]